MTRSLGTVGKDRAELSPMRFRRLRIAWSVTWGVLAVLLVVLWMRSYWWADVYAVAISKLTFVGVASANGTIIPFRVDNGFGTPIGTCHIDSDAVGDNGDFIVHESPSYCGAFGFGVRRELSNSLLEVVAPHWFAFVFATSLSISPWLSFKRFSLRTLLIATTLIAMVLGLIVWAAR
jgi:hypothetical protein